MSRNTQIFAVGLLLISILSGCATKYQAGERRGYSETRLSEDAYQVRFQGDIATSQDRASQFLLRRCAELTLENGKRYFTIGATAAAISVVDGFSIPGGQSTMKMLNRKDEAPIAIDAVIVIQETNQIAERKLSPKAQETLSLLTNQTAKPWGG